MKKTFNIILKIVLVVLLLSPILGTLGIFPAPTPDMYNTALSYDFISMLMSTKYIMWMMSVVFLICIVQIFRNKMASVALLLLPITLNIIGFHLFLDGGLFTAGAVMADVLFLINIYFLWENRKAYKGLC
jgi:hypothetical protein